MPSPDDLIAQHCTCLFGLSNVEVLTGWLAMCTVIPGWPTPIVLNSGMPLHPCKSQPPKFGYSPLIPKM